MSWMTALCELYDRNANIAGKQIVDEKGKSTVLLPIAHITQAAQIEVVLSQNGEFLGARTLEKAENSTIVPATEGSASRTSKPCPHPLCDKLKYVAKDYAYYLECDDKEKQKYINECFNPYLQQLNEWSSSEYSHLKVQSIAKYMNESGGLVGDLIGCGVLAADEKGLLDISKKIQGLPQADAFVRFVVRSDKISDQPDEVWLDSTLHEKFIQYQTAKADNKDLCYATGEHETLTYLHPSKIMNEGDMTKLISFNDSSGFTYRGRFDDKTEVSAVGYNTSQKTHNALKWIIRRQGFTNGSFCFVSWESADSAMPSIMDGMPDMMLEMFGDALNDDNSNDTNYIDAQKFNQSLMGYGKKLDYNQNMYLMTLEASTPGRLSMTGFTTINSSRYVENIANWQKSCGWIHYTKKNEKVISYCGMPGIKNIAEILYGNEGNGYMSLSGNNSVMLNTTIKRLLPCISQGKKIPRDMVDTAVQRASSPVSYKDEKCWRQTLALACSMVKKLKYDYNSEVWNMALDTKCTDRSYLYGRLLAIADLIEQRATFEEEKGKVTNAKRYMNAFAQRPFRTWQIIEEKLEPYSRKLKSKWLLTQLDEIHNMFSPEDYADDSRLDGLYLLGYHSQIYAINSFNKEVSETNDSEEND
ncbi:MAG: type I-C CRISPR-associated protein Cas8c/Csd1 [Firmicutes bacterium]|nr:type I-C CRISPR-associated protein Cas8c/Csd1 [Bacillota bacterium]